jgi:FtsH-binding integral membrane protein
MQKFLRRIRGAIGMGLTWGAAWGAAGSVPRWLFGFNADVPFPLVFGVLGFIAGVTFFAVLVVTEGRRSLDEMSLPRFSAWGALGGLLVSAVFTRVASLGAADVLMVAPAFVIASAACAAGSLALARREVKRELPTSRWGIAEAKLTDPEKWKLREGGE